MAHAIEYHRLRAPREHGQALIEPPPGEVAALLAYNQRIASASASIGGVSLAELTRDARAELFSAAQQYTLSTLHADAGWSAAAVRALTPRSTFLLAGHQPELFHPGVWFKNFVLSELGQRYDATPINLIVDNDQAGMPLLRVPRHLHGATQLDTIAYDAAFAPCPYEERPIVSREQFAHFAQAIDPHRERIATPLWKYATTGSPQLGLRLAAARHNLELSQGLRTLEVPLGVVCDTRSFARFALHLLVNLPALRDIYNQAVLDYRSVNKVRSSTHPVPLLQTDGEWLEAPLWIWSEDSPQRQPAYARVTKTEVIVSDLRQQRVDLPLKDGRIGERTIDAWLAARRGGVKLRPRALVTTLYARLLLSDLFLHGIGGAKYDQVTDAIIERFFGLTPPRYMTVTATMKLFPEYSSATIAARLREVEHALHELPYHPEVLANATSSAAFETLRQKKLRLLADPPPQGQRKAWHAAIAGLNPLLFEYRRADYAQLQAERERLQHDLHLHAQLGSREFSFCLFEEKLIDELKRMASL